MQNRKLLLRAFAVIAMGIVASSFTAKNAQAFADDDDDDDEAGDEPYGCVWCRTSCPADVIAYCNSKCGSAQGNGCVVQSCTGVNQYTYTYRVNCGTTVE